MKIQINLAMALKNSYRNFHAKGLDYICLSRSEAFTTKLYILDGDASKVPEVVNPHDHRYSFHTAVLKGKMVDHRWARSQEGVEGAFDYMTPLNGGNGFTYRGEEWLLKDLTTTMEFGDMGLQTRAQHVHTIQMLADQTALLLHQFSDIYDRATPTSTWSKGTPSISDSGLYDRFTEAQLIERLSQIGFEVEHKEAE